MIEITFQADDGNSQRPLRGLQTPVKQSKLYHYCNDKWDTA